MSSGCNDIAQAQKVVLSAGKLAFGFYLSVTIAGDTGGFFKDLTSVLALGGNDRIDLALTDHRITVTTETGIHKQLMDIFQAHCRLVDQVFTLAGTIVASGDCDLVAAVRQKTIGIIDGQRDLSVSAALSLVGTVENDVFHLRTAQRLRRLFAQHPADRVGNITFSGAVGSNDGGNTGIEG